MSIARITFTSLAVAALSLTGATAHAEIVTSNDATGDEVSYAGTSNDTSSRSSYTVDGGQVTTSGVEHVRVVVGYTPVIDPDTELPVLDENGDPVLRPVWGWAPIVTPRDGLTFLSSNGGH